MPALAPPAPSPKFLFNYTGEETVTLTSDITDHFVENNTALQDQISLKPETVTTSGFIGELNNVPPDALKIAKFVADKLGTLAPFVPAVASTAAVAYNTAVSVYSTANLAAKSAVSLIDTISGKSKTNPVQTAQQKAFTQFYAYWQKRTLFTVQTPWNVFKDMAILSLRAVQEEDTRMVTNFEITFKQMKFAKTTLLGTNQQGRLASQASAIVEQGIGKPVPDVGLTSAVSTSGVAN